MKILVTGGAGFIGSNLVIKLASENHMVTVVDNLTEGKKENLKSVLDHIEFVNGDVRNQSLMENIVSKVDVVFHLAANASVPNSVLNPRYDFETNVLGTFNLLKASTDSNVKKFVLASSAAVYGDLLEPQADENCPTDPVSPYGASKLSAEVQALSFKRTYGLPVAIARIFNVYGPMLPRYVLYDFYMKLKATPNKLEVLGDGEQVRQFCYVTDAIDALLLLQKAGEGVFNVAGNQQTRIKDLAKFVIENISPQAKIEYTGKSWSGDIKTLVGDISKLRKLGFEPKVAIDDGVRMTIDWFTKNEHSLGFAKNGKKNIQD